MSGREGRAVAQELKNHLLILGGFVGLMWVLELLDLFLLRGHLNLYGIRPRSLIGLRGVLFAPFLHSSLSHLIGNTIPFIILGWLIMLRETSDFFLVTVISALASGVGTWLFGLPGTIHIGASGVIYGYLGYLILRGYFERSGLAIALSLFVLALYSSLFWGLLPFQPNISWEGHLFGFVGGVLSAWLLAEDSKKNSSNF